MTVLYYTGCMASFRLENIAKSTIELLKKADVDFKMLGDKEWCCGSVLLRTGNKELAVETAKHNFEAFNASGADKVVTSCAGCYNTIRNDYPKLLGENGLKILSTPELINELIDAGKIKFKNTDLIVTFHDPCHLGRHSNVYEEPRKVLSSIEGLKLVEMPRNRENARCCGSGGGVQAAFKDLAHKMADTRILEATETGANIVTSPCPFCTYALKEAAERTGTGIQVKDFAEFILDLIE